METHYETGDKKTLRHSESVQIKDLQKNLNPINDFLLLLVNHMWDHVSNY